MYMRANKNKECNYCNYMFNKIQFIIMKKNLLVLATGLFCWTGVHAATNYYVYDGDKSAADNGTALQAAIDAAAESGIDTLKVQAGTYQGKFTMKEGVNVVGGWNEDFSSRTDYATTLDANESGIVLSQSAAFTTLTVWENLTIQNGKTTGNNAHGAGVVLNKKGQIKHCHVTHNTSAGQGGGVYNDAVDSNTDVCVDDCLIDYNSATHGAGVRIRGTIQNSEVANDTTSNNAGGGIHLQGGRAVNCKVHHNSATGAGGIRAYGTCEITDCEIYNNSASTGPSGGVQMENNATVMKNCKVHDNTSAGDVGGVRIAAANCKLLNCLIYNNTASGVSGGVQLENGASIIQNCSVHDNTSAGNVGGVRMAAANCKLLNCLIYNNTAGGVCGGVRVESTGSDVIGNTIVGNDQTPSDENANGGHCGLSCATSATFTNATLANNIIWGNKHKGAVNSAKIYYISRYPTIANNAVYNQNTTKGINLPADDPGFVDAANGKYLLLWNSDLVNAGSNAASQGEYDLAGNARIAGGTVDIGAYELEHYTLTISAFEHATLTLADAEKEAGAYVLPKGYTADATITPDSGYTIKSVTLNDEPLVPAEEVYTLPALAADAVLTITMEQSPVTAIDNTSANAKAHKVIRNGQLMIIRNGEIFNALGTKMD